MAMVLEDIMTQARYRADMENSTFVSDAELITYINKSLNDLYDLLVVNFGDDYFVTTDTRTTDGYTMSLPSDFYKVLGVDMIVSGKAYTLAPFSFAERNKYRNSGDNGAIVNGVPRYRYRITGDSLYLYPEPGDDGYEVTLWYVPRMTDLSAGQSTNNAIVESWIEYVIVDAAIKMMIKEESDVTALMQTKSDIVQRILAVSKNRDIVNAEVQQDTSNTLYNLRIQARQRSGMPDNSIVTDTELNFYINNSMGELQDFLVRAYGNDYFLTSYEFTTVASTSTYTLPTDFYKLGGVDIASNGNTFSLEQFNFAERNVYANSNLTTWGGDPLYRYRLIGNTIKLLPVPDSAYTITLWYTPQLAKLTDDTDTVDSSIIVSWLEFVVIDAAIKIRTKLGADASYLTAQKSDMIQRLTEMAENRNWGEPETVICTANIRLREWEF